MTKSWKTSLCGLVAAIGSYLITVHDPAWVAPVGQLMLAVGTFLTGLFARDSNVTSEAAGAKNP